VPGIQWKQSASETYAVAGPSGYLVNWDSYYCEATYGDLGTVTQFLSLEGTLTDALNSGGWEIRINDSGGAPDGVRRESPQPQPFAAPYYEFDGIDLNPSRPSDEVQWEHPPAFVGWGVAQVQTYQLDSEGDPYPSASGGDFGTVLDPISPPTPVQLTDPCAINIWAALVFE
jgi:hypothetical protein